MADLIARGPEQKIYWRHPLPARPVTLGREPTKSEWAVPEDKQIHGLHATLLWQGGTLVVRPIPTNRNKIVFRGQTAPPAEEFLVPVGEKFLIGTTTFVVHESERTEVVDLPTPNSELTCSPQELRQVQYTDPHQRIEALAALPKLIHESRSDLELENEVVAVLLRGMAHAEAAAVVRLNPAALAVADDDSVRRLGPAAVAAASAPAEVRCAKGGSKLKPFQPSHRLIVSALRQRRGVLHTWRAGEKGPESSIPQDSWGLCVPLPDDPQPGWALYVTGQVDREARRGNASAEDVRKSDLKFAELVADIFGALRQVRDLQRRQAVLTRFFSRPVLAALAQKDMDEVLKPREADVTVLFCDLRSSCRIHEAGQADLSKLWRSVSEALDLMASSILDQDGVIGDFQGDAVMGFWGWPLALPNQVERAARAALAIQRRLAHAAQLPDHPLRNFRCGVGIAHGRAIAGRLGTLDQFKVDVFGPVVNLAARLEGMTKKFHVSILLDAQAAKQLRRAPDPSGGRCRRLARVQPYGMNTVVEVSELLPSAVEAGAMPERQRRDYEAALDAFEAGRWADARALLAKLPGEGKDQFVSEFMDAHPQGPPAGWNGVMEMKEK
jgi:adenylate cyclase